VTKLQIRILENQIGREWGNSKWSLKDSKEKCQTWKH
jgi:hypothetical protein